MLQALPLFGAGRVALEESVFHFIVVLLDDAQVAVFSLRQCVVNRRQAQQPVLLHRLDLQQLRGPLAVKFGVTVDNNRLELRLHAL